MSVVLYKEGNSKTVRGVNCDSCIISGDIQHALNNGWHLSVEELYREEITEPNESESEESKIEFDDQNDSLLLSHDGNTFNLTDEDSVRQMAKKEGIKSWHLKNIDKLLEELKEIENGGPNESGSDQ